MIDTAEQIICKDCGRPLVQAKRPTPHKREFCNGTCRKRWHRKQKEQSARSNATIATMDAQARIAELEQRNAELEQEVAELQREKEDLQARLNFEERFLTDTKKRDFKRWLRNHPQPRDTRFFQRFLDDRDMPSEASRSKYEGLLRLHSKNYDEIDILLFKDAWRRMLFDQT